MTLYAAFEATVIAAACGWALWHTATRVLKLRQIEPEFLERMFSTEDV